MPVGDVVVLAIPGRVVAVLPEHFRERPAALGHQGVVARKAGGALHDEAGRAGMMVAPGEQPRPSGRAERAGVELRVAQAVLRQPVKGGRRDRPAERTRGAEANVVGHDQQDVGRALGRHDARCPPSF